MNANQHEFGKSGERNHRKERLKSTAEAAASAEKTQRRIDKEGWGFHSQKSLDITAI
jgi:hypothetical protein